MKLATYSEYDPRAIALTEAALFTVWGALGTYADDIVLVGGLVPKYLCGDLAAPRELPRPATLDVDLGIAVGASAGQYGSIDMDLAGQGFSRSEKQAGRFEKIVEGFTIYLDFITELPGSTRGTVMIDNAPASVLPGINRALECFRTIAVEGTDLHGATQRLRLRVCEAGPFLTLKLRAFANRQQPKDAFDILYTCLYYSAGASTAAAAFGAEASAKNTAFSDAAQALVDFFLSETASGPVQAERFLFGERRPDDSADLRTRRAMLREQVVNVGLALQAAIPAKR